MYYDVIFQMIVREMSCNRPYLKRMCDDIYLQVVKIDWLTSNDRYDMWVDLIYLATDQSDESWLDFFTKYPFYEALQYIPKEYQCQELELICKVG